MDDLNFYPCTCGYQVSDLMGRNGATIWMDSSSEIPKGRIAFEVIVTVFFCCRYVDFAGIVFVRMKMVSVRRVGRRIRRIRPILHHFRKNRFDSYMNLRLFEYRMTKKNSVMIDKNSFCIILFLIVQNLRKCSI